MPDITVRRMQAEAEANDDISAKDYQHTSAYQILHNDNPTDNKNLELASGSAIKEALLRRAKAKEMGLDNLSFEKSQIGRGNYKESAFENSDDESRKTMLGTADRKLSVREKERRDRFINKDRKQRFNATGDADSGNTGQVPNNRQSFNSRQQHTFQEPNSRNYNPYA
ncbi:hypothetical protein GX865_03225 [Candidatus Saccharibacteria bacterium]|jgi:hypothetical protein|nr:hypothetical protein [Candidatus Saccharibacteria bacterium]